MRWGVALRTGRHENISTSKWDWEKKSGRQAVVKHPSSQADEQLGRVPTSNGQYKPTWVSLVQQLQLCLINVKHRRNSGTEIVR